MNYTVEFCENLGYNIYKGKKLIVGGINQKYVAYKVCDELNNPSETVWIEFEAWLDDVAIQGYMALDEADDDAPLQFFGWDGLECGNHISKTKYPYFKEDQEFKWETLTQWFKETDVAHTLAEFAEEKILYFMTESDWGRRFDVELYINCSKLNLGGLE